MSHSFIIIIYLYFTSLSILSTSSTSQLSSTVGNHLRRPPLPAITSVHHLKIVTINRKSPSSMKNHHKQIITLPPTQVIISDHHLQITHYYIKLTITHYYIKLTRFKTKNTIIKQKSPQNHHATTTSTHPPTTNHQHNNILNKNHQCKTKITNTSYMLLHSTSPISTIHHHCKFHHNTESWP